MNLAIVGTRTPSVSYQQWEELLLSKVNKSEITQVVSGGAKRINTYAKIFAARHHIPLMEFLPQYAVYGKAAPLRRNAQIIREANIVIAFPSSDSRGTLQGYTSSTITIVHGFHLHLWRARRNKIHTLTTMRTNAEIEDLNILCSKLNTEHNIFCRQPEN